MLVYLSLAQPQLGCASYIKPANKMATKSYQGFQLKKNAKGAAMWTLHGKRVAAKDVPPSTRAAFESGEANANYHGFVVYARPGEIDFERTGLQSEEITLVFVQIVKSFETLASVDVPTRAYRIKNPKSGEEFILALPDKPDLSKTDRIFTFWYTPTNGGKSISAEALLRHLNYDFGSLLTSKRSPPKKSPPKKSPAKSPKKSPAKSKKEEVDIDKLTRKLGKLELQYNLLAEFVQKLAEEGETGSISPKDQRELIEAARLLVGKYKMI